jgi:hypothetical protein
MGPTSGENNKKMAVLQRVNSITAKLLVIAAERQSLSQRGVQRSSHVDVDRLIQKQDSLEVLARLAATSRAYMHPGRAEDQLIDNVLDAAWHSCIRRIEQIGGQAAIETLQEMALEQHLDGAYSMVHRASLDRLKAKMRPPK